MTNWVYTKYDLFRRLERLISEIGFYSAIKAHHLFKVTAPYTMIGRKRLEMLYSLGSKTNTENIEGDIVECGTCNGGSAAILADSCLRNTNKRRMMWLFDSFEGLPNRWFWTVKKLNPMLGCWSETWKKLKN